MKVLKRGGRKRATGQSQELISVGALDFVSDALANGRKVRLLTVVDVHTKESLKIAVEYSLNGRKVLRVLKELIRERGKPEDILSDNETEFTSNPASPNKTETSKASMGSCETNA